jgi:hypothetical protein
MIYSASVKERRAAPQAVNYVAFTEQELGEIRAVLASDAGYQRCLIIHRGLKLAPKNISAEFVFQCLAEGSRP